MATLKDIAERVGVSISTVSRAISNDTSRPVNEATKRKVRDAASELGYEWSDAPKKPSLGDPGARGKADKTAHKIGCLIPERLMDNHPYFAPILTGFRKKLGGAGQPPASIWTLEEVGGLDRMRELLRETAVKGILTVGWYDPAWFALFQEEGVLTIGVSINDEKLSFPTVDCDRFSAARAAVRHLVGQGHSRIGYIGGPGFFGKLDSDERYLGYKLAMLEAGCPPPDVLLLDAGWNVDRSYSLMADMLALLEDPEERPTAMFCASDMLAIPAMRAALERGFRIPDDIAFVGMDNIEVAQYTSPPLTSVQVPKHEIGETAAKALLDFLEGEFPLPPKIMLPYEIIVRESSIFNRHSSNE